MEQALVPAAATAPKMVYNAHPSPFSSNRCPGLERQLFVFLVQESGADMEV